eukprot:10573912-Heterocapsa_arctica.AAC.1
MELGLLKELKERRNNADGACVMCGAPKAGVEHIWWECTALNGVANFGLQKLKQRRANTQTCLFL